VPIHQLCCFTHQCITYRIESGVVITKAEAATLKEWSKTALNIVETARRYVNFAQDLLSEFNTKVAQGYTSLTESEAKILNDWSKAALNVIETANDYASFVPAILRRAIERLERYDNSLTKEETDQLKEWSNVAAGHMNRFFNALTERLQHNNIYLTENQIQALQEQISKAASLFIEKKK
jgi:hypothetical protein